jgi:hypothetical protein
VAQDDVWFVTGRSLKTPEHPIAGYQETAMARRQRTHANSGQQPRDPVR